MQNTQWKDIPGYEGLYQVSNKGEVKSHSRYIEKRMYGGGTHKYLRSERIKKADVSHQGYHTIELSKKTDKKRFKVHRLVAIVFIPNPLNKPFINHIDNNPSNNHVSNLEWCTGSENVMHSIRQGRSMPKFPILRGEKVNTCKLTEDKVKEILRSSDSQRVLAARYGVSRIAIKFIQQKRNWKHVSA